jgi:hypothetical protein
LQCGKSRAAPVESGHPAVHQRYVVEYDEPLDNWAKPPSAIAMVVMLPVVALEVAEH